MYVHIYVRISVGRQYWGVANFHVVWTHLFIGFSILLYSIAGWLCPFLNLFKSFLRFFFLPYFILGTMNLQSWIYCKNTQVIVITWDWLPGVVHSSINPRSLFQGIPAEVQKCPMLSCLSSLSYSTLTPAAAYSSCDIIIVLNMQIPVNDCHFPHHFLARGRWKQKPLCCPLISHGTTKSVESW